MRIGVLTGGGDCPGLNAVIRAVTKGAIHHRIDVVGIEEGSWCGRRVLVSAPAPAFLTPRPSCLAAPPRAGRPAERR